VENVPESVAFCGGENFVFEHIASNGLDAVAQIGLGNKLFCHGTNAGELVNTTIAFGQSLANLKAKGAGAPTDIHKVVGCVTEMRCQEGRQNHRCVRCLTLHCIDE